MDEVFPPDVNLTILIGTPAKNNGWSALTMITEKGNQIIIHNHLHSESRQQSDIMHELAHIICEHGSPKSREDVNLPFFMREHDKKQEEEANCLGSILQISREGLVWALKKKLSPEEIAGYYKASEQMVNFRLNSSGVRFQFKNRYRRN